MSLRSINLILLGSNFPLLAAIRFLLLEQDTPQLAARGILMVFLYLIRRSHTLNIQSFTQYSLPSAPCPMLSGLCSLPHALGPMPLLPHYPLPSTHSPSRIPPSIHSRNSNAGGCRKTIFTAGRAAARAVRIIKGSDNPSAAQSTPYRNVQPNDCRLITYTSR